jgi:hypothetical protein
MPYTYRHATDQDLRFVIGSWLYSYRTSFSAGLIQMDSWIEVMEPQIRAVLARPDCEVYCAIDPNTDDRRIDVFGWMAFEGTTESGPPLVHYAYVKEPYRRMGLARGLLKQLGLDLCSVFAYTCKTAVVSRLPIPRAEWRPLIARHTTPTTKEQHARKKARPGPTEEEG